MYMCTCSIMLISLVLLGMYLESISCFDTMAFCKGGAFMMGIRDKNAGNGEHPPYSSAVKPFLIDKYPVTNLLWSEFARIHPKFKTDSEKQGWSYVFSGYLHKSVIVHGQKQKAKIEEPWMLPISLASWKKPLGPGSTWEDIPEHPVVHVSKRDAQAYCQSQGMRLPTEHEWEYAARGGVHGLEYPWGDSYEKGKTNLWQGTFPQKDSGRDGWAGTSPVTFYGPQNSYDMFDMIGNVWEWTKTTWHKRHRAETVKDHYFVLRGASHLDSRKGNIGEVARIATRINHIMYYSAGNVGFRCAKTVTLKDDGTFDDNLFERKVEVKPKRQMMYIRHTEL